MMNFIKSIKNVYWLYKPYFKYGKLFVFLSLFFWLFMVPLCQMLNVYLPTAIIQSLESKISFVEIAGLVIIIQVILMLQPIYENFFNMFCKNIKLPYIEIKMKRDAYKKAINTDYRYIDNPDYYNNYSWAVNQYASKAQEAQRLLNRMISSVITATSMLAVITILSPVAILVTVFGTILENFMHIRTNYYDVAKDEKIVPYDRRLGYYHRVFYLSDYAADIKSTNVESYLEKGYEQASREKLSIIKKSGRKMIPWAIGADFTFYIARTFVILNIVYSIYVGDISTTGAYVTLMLAVEKLKDSLNDMFYYVKDANRLSIYAQKIRDFFNTESKIEVNKSAGELPPRNLFSIEFKNVCFSYPNSLFAIKNMSFNISEGEKIAIVGENGVGKSTLIKLLLRLYDVDSGCIKINGKSIDKYSLEKLRREIGVAFQKPNIYSLPFRDNIELYEKTEDKEFYDIIDRFGLSKVLEKNNADIETEMTKEFNKDGIMLSGGEAQKIGIARLFTKKFGLLLFDEPSSALDPIAEYEITQQILEASNLSTTIIVAHRLSTIRNVDRILLVDEGRILESGTHDELMALNGKYREMFTKQAENYAM